MPKFSYSAKNLQGDIITGVYTAPEKDAVIAMLRGKDYFQLDIDRIREPKEKREIEFFPKVPLKELGVFCSQFAAVLKAGVPITQALEIMKSQTGGKKLGKIIADVKETIQQGKTISEAFAAHAHRFPRIFLSMIESGEVSGSLESSFQRMADNFSKEYKINQKLQSVMIYPSVLSVVALGVVAFLLVFIVPTFTRLYASSGIQLPLLTRMLLMFSDFMSHNILILILILAFITVSFNIYIHSSQGRLWLDRIKTSLPVVGKLLNTVYASRFTRSMSILFSSGIALPLALDITSVNIGNAYIGGKLKTVIEDVNKGRGLSAPLIDMNFFPPMVLHMCRLGEESGTLDTLLSQAADFYESEAETAMGRLASLVEPCVIVFMGGMVLFIVLSIMLPMFGMYSMVG